MVRLDRYIMRQVAAAIVAVLLVVLALDFIGKLIEQLDQLRGDYTLYELLVYVSWGLPRSIYEYLPYAVLVGCLIGLGVLANASELVIIRAAGVSVARIVWMVLKPVLVFIALGLLLGEYVIPYADQVSESRRALALGYKQNAQAQRGVWHREADEYIHFNVILPDGQVYGVTRYRFDDLNRLQEVSFAEEASFDGGQWEERELSITRFAEQQVVAERLARREWQTELTPGLLNTVVVPPEALSIGRLFQYTRYLKEQSLHNSEYALAFWQKVLQPVATASLVLIAISFIFGPLREVSMGQRIFTGVVFGILFRLLQSLLGPSSIVFGFPPFVAVLIPILLCLALGFYLLRRAG